MNLKSPHNRIRSACLLARVLGVAWVGVTLLTARPAIAAPPSQNDVFKSIQDSMDKPSDFDATPVLLLAGAGGVLLLLVLVGNRKQRGGRRAAAPPVHSPGKLMREVLKAVPLKPAEVTQLKLLAEAVPTGSDDELNPLTLLICPSLMAKGLNAKPGKVDRKLVAQVVRKLRSPAPGS